MSKGRPGLTANYIYIYTVSQLVVIEANKQWALTDHQGSQASVRLAMHRSLSKDARDCYTCQLFGLLWWEVERGLLLYTVICELMQKRARTYFCQGLGVGAE